MPPCWVRQRCQVDSVIAARRATSSIELPWANMLVISASYRITCSGACLLRFIVVWSSFSHGRIGLAPRVDPLTETRSGGALRPRPFVCRASLTEATDERKDSYASESESRRLANRQYQR